MCIRDRCKTSIYDDYKEEPENGLLFYENNPVTFSVMARSLKGDELTYQWYRKDNEHPTAAPYKLPEGRFYTGVTTSTLKMPVSVSYTHLDVYKRQPMRSHCRKAGWVPLRQAFPKTRWRFMLIKPTEVNLHFL